MIHYSRVIKGAVDYIDSEIVSQMNGSLKGWGLGIVTGLMAKKAEQLFAELREMPLVASLGIVEGEMVDVEAIYAEALRAAQRSSATVNLPVIGPVTFKAADVESLYRHITGA